MADLSQAEQVSNPRALELYRTKGCPCCGYKLSTFEAVSILWGDGYRQCVAVILDDGAQVAIPLEDFNPQTMKLSNDPSWGRQLPESVSRSPVGAEP